jgi:hypothetical protein
MVMIPAIIMVIFHIKAIRSWHHGWLPSLPLPIFCLASQQGLFEQFGIEFHGISWNFMGFGQLS